MSYTINKIKIVCELLINIFFGLLSYVIPKNNIIVFYPTLNSSAFTGNLKAVFLYAHNNDKENIKVVWYTSSYKTSQYLLSNNLPVYYSRIFPYWLMLKAKNIILDSNQNKLYGNYNLFQLWHGTGFKNIGLLVSESFKRKNYIINRINKNIYSSYKIIIANSEQDKIRKQKSFNNSNVIITGTPRNDILICKNKNSLYYKKEIGIPANIKNIITYAPTFRDKGDFIPFNNKFWARLSVYLQKKEILFIVKKHPNDKKLTIPTNFPNIVDYSKYDIDLQELLITTDLLVTDYSGIVTDYVLMKKPIIFYTYDYEDYITNCRDFYYDIEKILPGPFAVTEEKLLELIIDQSWFYVKSYKERYNEFYDMFHKYNDGMSSKRVWHAIMSNTNKA